MRIWGLIQRSKNPVQFSKGYKWDKVTNSDAMGVVIPLKFRTGADADMNIMIGTEVCKACSEVVDVVTGPSPINQDYTGEVPRV